MSRMFQPIIELIILNVTLNYRDEIQARKISDRINCYLQVFVLMQFDPGLEYRPSRGARGKDDAS